MSRTNRLRPVKRRRRRRTNKLRRQLQLQRLWTPSLTILTWSEWILPRGLSITQRRIWWPSAIRLLALPKCRSPIPNKLVSMFIRFCLMVLVIDAFATVLCNVTKSMHSPKWFFFSSLVWGKIFLFLHMERGEKKILEILEKSVTPFLSHFSTSGR